MGDINIIPRYGGIAVHDCWASCFSYEKLTNALCGLHLMRELEFIINSNLGAQYETDSERGWCSGLIKKEQAAHN